MSEGDWGRTSITVWTDSAEQEIRDVPGSSLEEQLQAVEHQLSEIATF